MSRLTSKYNAIALDEPVQVVEVGPVAGNPMLTKVIIKIAYHGFNRNGSYISKEAMENMIRRSLPLTPLVGNYLHKKGDFGGHDSHIEIDENYNLKEVRDTRVYGVVGEFPEVYWQNHVEKDGRIKEYIVTDAYLFTSRFEEAKRVLENQNWQSMEIDEKTVIGDFEEVPGAPWDIQQKNGGMVFNIKEANLIGLCILGADIEPAFESSDIRAVFSLFSKNKEEDKKGDFMSKLQKALKYNFSDDAYIASMNGTTKPVDEFEDEAGVGLTIADVDTDQEVEDIKEAVNRLDEAAEAEINPESQSAIDEAIDTMLKVEQELDIEDQLIPISDKAKEVADKMPGDMKDILSSPTFEKVDPLNKPFKEEETMTDKEKELLAQQQAAEAGAEAPAQTEPVAQPEAPAQEPAPAVAPVQEPAQPTEVTVQVEDTPAQTEIDPATGQPIEVAPRKTADEKRKEIELAKYGDDELLDILLSRVETAELIKQKLAQLNVAQEAPVEGEEGQAPVEGEAPAEFKKDEDEDDKDDINDVEDTDDANDTDDADDADDKGEAPAQEPAAPAPAKEEAPVEDEEEKKKKKNIQHFELENAKLALDYSKLKTEFEALQEEAKALREFKLAIENKEKEEVLSQFSLLDDATKENFRLNFSDMSKEDLEAKCALAYYRKGLMSQGQDSSASDAVISYNLEETSADNLPGWVKAVKSSKK